MGFMAKAKTKKKPRSNKKKVVQAIVKTKLLPRKAKKVAVSAAGLIDQRILNIAGDQYDKVRKQIGRRKQQLDLEGRVALELGERILGRAKEVRASLLTKKKRKPPKAPEAPRH